MSDGDDVDGGVAIVNFADLTWKAALTGDSLAFEPVAAQEQLVDLSWLLGRGRSRRVAKGR